MNIEDPRAIKLKELQDYGAHKEYKSRRDLFAAAALQGMRCRGCMPMGIGMDQRMMT